MYTFKSSRAFKCYYWFIHSSCDKINVHINGQQGNKDNSLNCNNREVFNIQFIIIHSFYSTVNALMDFSEKNTTIVLKRFCIICTESLQVSSQLKYDKKQDNKWRYWRVPTRLQHIHESLKCRASTLHGKGTLKSLYIEVWSSTTMIFLCRHREEKKRKDNTPDSVGW